MTNHGIDSEHIPAVDAAAWSLISLLLFCVLCFAFAAWILWRREKSRSRFPMDSGDTGKSTGQILPGDASEEIQKESRAPWERDENWWRKPPSD